MRCRWRRWLLLAFWVGCCWASAPSAAATPGWSELSELLAAVETELTLSIEQLQELRAELWTSGEESARLRAQLAELQSTLSGLGQESTALRQQLAALRSELSASRQESSELSEELSRSKTDSAALRSSLGEAERSLTDYQRAQQARHVQRTLFEVVLGAGSFLIGMLLKGVF